MANLPLAKIDPTLLALMHGAFGPDGQLQPYAREIMLIECPVAGTSHRDLTAIEPGLAVGSLLVLQREPANPHDPLAILIRTESGHALGYVPRAKNEALARLMDAGKLLFGRLEAKSWHDTWLKLDARLYLRDF